MPRTDPGARLRVGVPATHYTDFSRIWELGKPPPAEIMRLRKTEGYMRDQFLGRGFKVLSTEPLKGEMARISNIADCNGCGIVFGQAARFGSCGLRRPPHGSGAT